GLGGDARGARGGDGREAGGPGGRGGRVGNVEGSHRQREFHGGKSHRAGAEHRRGDEGGGDGRSLEEDHGERARGDPRAEGYDQHDGGSAELLRCRGDARGARGGDGREAGGAGGREGRGRHLEGPHRQRELRSQERRGG